MAGRPLPRPWVREITGTCVYDREQQLVHAACVLLVPRLLEMQGIAMASLIPHICVQRTVIPLSLPLGLCTMHECFKGKVEKRTAK